MNKSAKQSYIIGLIIMAAWAVIMLTAVHFFFLSAAGWAGLIFGILSFLIGFTSRYLWEAGSQQGRAMTEVNALPTVLNYGYLVISIIANTVFCLTDRLFLDVKFPIILNIILIAIMLVARVGMESYRGNTEKNIERATDKVMDTNVVKRKIQDLLLDAQDPELKGALQKVRDTVNYSSTTLKAGSEERIDQMLQQLSLAQEAMANGDKAAALADIREAEKTWRRASL